jgi:hypothetical protein
VFVLYKFMWGPTHTVRVSYPWVCVTSVRSGLLYGTDDYVKAPYIVHSGANFIVYSARTLGLVVIIFMYHVFMPLIHCAAVRIGNVYYSVRMLSHLSD